MKKRMRRDENMPVGDLHIIDDFLPSPENIANQLRTARVTLHLDRYSVEFFKSESKRLGVKYQRMIREVLKQFAEHHRSRRKTA